MFVSGRPWCQKRQPVRTRIRGRDLQGCCREYAVRLTIEILLKRARSKGDTRKVCTSSLRVALVVGWCQTRRRPEYRPFETQESSITGRAGAQCRESIHHGDLVGWRRREKIAKGFACRSMPRQHQRQTTRPVRLDSLSTALGRPSINQSLALGRSCGARWAPKAPMLSEEKKPH